MRHFFRFFFCSLVLFVNYDFCIGQTMFQRTYGGVSGDGGYSVQQTSDGGYIIAGGTYSFGAGAEDFYLIKTNSFGDALWTKTYGGTYDDHARSVSQTSDGGYIVVGSIGSSNGSTDLYVVKIDSFGDTAWTKRYGGVGNDFGNSVQQTSDGGFIVAGGSADSLYLVKMNSTGDTLWTTKHIIPPIWGDTHSAMGNSVFQTQDGGFVIAGTITNVLVPDTWGNYAMLVKTNSTGDTLWTKAFPLWHGEANSIRPTGDGGYIILASKSEIIQIDTNAFSEAGRFYLIKTDSSGDTLWTKTYGETSNDYFGRSVGHTSDGGYVLVGSSSPFAGRSDVYIIKTNSTGDTLWTKRYGGPESDEGYAVQQTSDGGYAVAGWTASFGLGSSDVFLIKTDANGLVGVQQLAMSEVPTSFGLSQNFPNPFNPITQLYFNVPTKSHVLLTVHNVLGQEVAQLVNAAMNPGSYLVEWDARGHASGVYFCIFRANQFVSTRKLVLLR